MFANPLLAFLNFQAQQNNSLQIRSQPGFHNPPIIPPPPAAEAAAAEEEPSEEPVVPIQQPILINQVVQPPIEMHIFPQNPIEHHLRLSSFINNSNRNFEVENLMVQEKIYSIVEPSHIEEMRKEYKSPKPLTQVSKTSKKIAKAKAPKLTRKIVKNFGKAIASFACSEKALQMIEKSFRDCDRKKFKDFVYEHKECIEGNRRFKQLLTISSEDALDIRENKRIFKKISEIFMKSYVHQWIWNSKLLKKEDHAQLVSEMKKRIQNPSLLESLSN